MAQYSGWLWQWQKYIPPIAEQSQLSKHQIHDLDDTKPSLAPWRASNGFPFPLVKLTKHISSLLPSIISLFINVF